MTLNGNAYLFFTSKCKKVFPSLIRFGLHCTLHNVFSETATNNIN